MQAGLDVFAMEAPEHKELKAVERDLELMEQVSARHNMESLTDIDTPVCHSQSSPKKCVCLPAQMMQLMRLNFLSTFPGNASQHVCVILTLAQADHEMSRAEAHTMDTHILHFALVRLRRTRHRLDLCRTITTHACDWMLPVRLPLLLIKLTTFRPCRSGPLQRIGRMPGTGGRLAYLPRWMLRRWRQLQPPSTNRYCANCSALVQVGSKRTDDRQDLNTGSK